MEFFERFLFFLLLVVGLAVFVSFFFGFQFWSKFIFSSKDAAATTAAVIRTDYKNNNYAVVTDIEDCILLTGIVSPVNFYRSFNIQCNISVHFSI